jgi:uncharacterized protein (TIGR01244 family)
MKLIRTLARISGLTLVLALVPACSSGSDTEAGTGAKAATSEKLEPYSCGSVARLHTFGSLFLASQPSPADFEQAQKNGVRTVINLRHDSEIKDFDERRVVTDLGMVYVHEPFDSPEELTDAVFDRCRQLLATAERPILLHCNSANRVGAVWIAWRVLDGGLPLEQAVAEAKTIGLKAPALEERARAYVAQHARGS